MGKTLIMDHPLIQHKIGILRSTETGTKDFRELVGEIATLECYEATRDLALEDYPVETPIGKTIGKRLAGKKLAIIPILRAGLGMVPGMQTLIPSAKVGHIGLYRDPATLAPVEYYCKLPADIEERDVFVVDPMLATGGSAAAAIEYLRGRGVEGTIKLVVLVSAPEGIERVLAADPDVHIYTAAIDEGLNENAYIVPGLGDAGDRIFGTK